MLPDSTQVYVRLSGEVGNPYADPYNEGTVNPTAPGWGGPSGFSQNNTARADYWSQLPFSGGSPAGDPGDGSAFKSANVETLPAIGDHIGLIGGAMTFGGGWASPAWPKPMIEGEPGRACFFQRFLADVQPPRRGPVPPGSQEVVLSPDACRTDRP